MATKLIRVKITGLGTQRLYRRKYNFNLCKADKPIPKLQEKDGIFTFPEVMEFSFENMPQVPKLFGDQEQPSTNFRWFECPVEVEDAKGNKFRGIYQATINKISQVYLSQGVDFSVKL